MSISELTTRVAAKLGDWLQPQLLVERLTDDAWVLPAVLLLELVIVGWAASSLRRLTRWQTTGITDLMAVAMGYLRITFLLSVLLSAGLYSLGLRSIGLLPTPLITDWGVWQTIAAILAYDLALYLQHHLVHYSKSLWRIHQFHHSATEFTVLTGSRFHPLEAALEGIFVGLASAMVGVPWQLLAGFGVFQLGYNALRHGNWIHDWGWFGRWGLLSPAAHRLHHSDDPAHYGKNLGFLLPIWDHLFGTWYDPRGKTVTLGVPGSTLGEQGWFRGVWSCYQDFFRQLFSSRSAKPGTMST